MPRSTKGWYDLVEREGWAFVEVPAKGGKAGVKRIYKPTPEVRLLIDARSSAQGADEVGNRTVATSTSSPYEVQVVRPVASERALLRWMERSPDLAMNAMVALVALQSEGGPIDREHVGKVTMRLMDLLVAATGGDEAKLARMLDNQDTLKAALQVALDAENPADE